MVEISINCFDYVSFWKAYVMIEISVDGGVWLNPNVLVVLVLVNVVANFGVVQILWVVF